MLIQSEFFDLKYNIKPEDKMIIDILMQVEELRLRRGWTQAELAKRVGTTQSAIARLEAGFSLPSLKMLIKLADAFGTTLVEPKFAELMEPKKQGQAGTRNGSVLALGQRKKPRVTKGFQRRQSEAIYAESKSGSTSAEE